MTWPYPGDSPVARARRIALAYRQAALGEDPSVAVARLDAKCQEWGEGWVTPKLALFEPDDLITVQQAAELVSVHPDTIGALRRSGRLPGRMINRKWWYLARDVSAVISTTRHRRKL